MGTILFWMIYLLNKDLSLITALRSEDLIIEYTPSSNPKKEYWLIGSVWFGLVSLFNGISTFVGYLMPKPFS